ncbi:MAG: hypothetical protein N3B21_09660 [Clostridia bacterium]|nr:hypothetical protein [Clostridia bacterium]
MAGNLRNAPIIRAILIVLIGTLAFNLLFSLFNGGGNTMDHMGGMGFSLASLLVFIINILMVVLVIALVVGAFIWARNNFFKNANSQIMQSINKDPVLRTILTVTGAIIGIIFIFALLNSFSPSGMGFGLGFGFNPLHSIAVLLMLITRILTIVLILSVIMAIVSYLKTQYDKGNLNLSGSNNKCQCSDTPGDGNNNNPNQS